MSVTIKMRRKSTRLVSDQGSTPERLDLMEAITEIEIGFDGSHSILKSILIIYTSKSNFDTIFI